MKTKRYFLIFLTPALLLITLVNGCGESYTPENLDTAREAGYSEGYAAGKTKGYSAGHDEGYNTGNAEGYEAGHKAGYETGNTDGYETGLDEGYDTGKDDGYKAGHNEGYDAGIIELESITQEAEKFGYDKGYKAGYDKGHSIGILVGKLEALMERLETQEAERARLDDLAYIKAYLSNYSDDADPQAEGIELGIILYDSKSRIIIVEGVPLTVAIKLYETGERPNTVGGWLIYQDTVTINSTSESIRIPFKDLERIRTNYSSDYQICMKVTVTTPNQRNFSVTSDSGFLELPRP